MRRIKNISSETQTDTETKVSDIGTIDVSAWQEFPCDDTQWEYLVSSYPDIFETVYSSWGGWDVEEAPIDGSTYGRKDGAWTVFSGWGAGNVDIIHQLSLYSDSASKNLWSALPANSVVKKVYMKVTTVFDGSPASTISVGDSGDSDLIVPSTAVDTTSQDLYVFETFHRFTTTKQLIVFLESNGATQWEVEVMVEYALV